MIQRIVFSTDEDGNITYTKLDMYVCAVRGNMGILRKYIEKNAKYLNNHFSRQMLLCFASLEIPISHDHSVVLCLVPNRGLYQGIVDCAINCGNYDREYEIKLALDWFKKFKDTEKRNKLKIPLGIFPTKKSDNERAKMYLTSGAASVVCVDIKGDSLSSLLPELSKIRERYEGQTKEVSNFRELNSKICESYMNKGSLVVSYVTIPTYDPRDHMIERSRDLASRLKDTVVYLEKDEDSKYRIFVMKKTMRRKLYIPEIDSSGKLRFRLRKEWLDAVDHEDAGDEDGLFQIEERDPRRKKCKPIGRQPAPEETDSEILEESEEEEEDE